jgi:hypothetical protein
VKPRKSNTSGRALALRRRFSSARGKIDFVGTGVGFEDCKSIVGFEQWAAIEGKYQPTSGAGGSIEA